MFATYVHNLNPVALPIYGGIALRWYGLAYLMGFVGGFVLLRNLAKRGLYVLKPEQIADCIAAAALFGVFLGGRVGYILFYFKEGFLVLTQKDHWWQTRVSLNHNWFESILHDPLVVLRVWEGGMASHGGILGLFVFTWFYAKKHKVTWTGLGDGLCVVAPLGIFFGRAANFINGELYGRVCEGVAWAMKFPLSLLEEPAQVQSAAWQECTRVDPKLANTESFNDLIAAARENPQVARTLGNYLPERHPSQIYEGLLEGLLLFTILWVVRTRCPKAPDGLLTGLFFALYASFRIFSEQFREPDAPMVGSLTKGQFFSVFMFAFAIAFFIHAWRGWERAQAARDARQ